MSGDLCPICTEDIQIYSFGECNHEVCHLCSLRLRALYKNNQCALCKTEISALIYTRTSNEEKQFSGYKLDTLIRDQKLGVCFENEDIRDEILLLLHFNCPAVDCAVTDANGWLDLMQHCKRHHGQSLCEICVRNKKVFAHEHTLYSPRDLQNHLRDTHPFCKFCQKYFYSSDELYEHCRSRHEQCHICKKRGIMHEYFRDYDELEKHFGTEHYLCKQKFCLEQKFVVFESEIDLRAHFAECHATSKSEAKRILKLDMDYQYAGEQQQQSSQSYSSSGRDGRGRGAGGPRAFNAAQALQSQHQNQQQNVPRNAPTSFGGQLSTAAPQSTGNGGDSSSRNGSAEGLSEQQRQQPSLGVKKLWDEELLEPSFRRLVQSSKIKQQEESVVPQIVEMLGNDPHQWQLFKSNCINYLKGVVLPDKIYSQLETAAAARSKSGDAKVEDKVLLLFKKVIQLFPEHARLRADLQSLYNDKRARLNQADSDLRTGNKRAVNGDDSNLVQTMQDLGLNAIQRAKILSIKSSHAGSASSGKGRNKQSSAATSVWGKKQPSTTNNISPARFNPDGTEKRDSVGTKVKIAIPLTTNKPATNSSKQSSTSATNGNRVDRASSPPMSSRLQQSQKFTADAFPALGSNGSSNYTNNTRQSSSSSISSVSYSKPFSKKSSVKQSNSDFPDLPAAPPKKNRFPIKSTKSQPQNAWDGQAASRLNGEQTMLTQTEIIERQIEQLQNSEDGSSKKKKKVLMKYG
ncbi:hypothetical protein MP228_005498 [Amoeboaphelidium protococcarum]|nr:hypothetical protein MP228_005498 [Amoeboaphelidium protococcarum]